MATVAHIISRALRLLGVVDATEAPEAEDFQTALDALNAMMARWEANGLALGWSSVEGPSDQAPIPTEAQDAVVSNLAMRLGAEYGVALRADVIAMASGGLAELQRDRLVANPIEMRSRLGIGARYNMVTDSYEW